MICDLLRNDLATVSVAGSVRVPQLAQIERFASVWHLVSVVEARLKPGCDAIDLLAAVVPGGSITGAPKKRAAEIIDELEDSRRGAMFGTVFRIGTDGALDSSIIIRSMLADKAAVTARAGGGIVAESDADAEHAEMRAKIAPLLDATGTLEPSG
jgi:para-aminobenzoate synthetase component 1